MMPQKGRKIDAPQLETGFYEGTPPSWLESAGGGTVTVQDASNEGGRAILNSGTAASGDEAVLKTTVPFLAEAYPILSIRMYGSTNSNDQTEMDATIEIGNGISNYIKFDVVDSVIRANNGSGETTTNTLERNPVNDFDAELRWNVARGTVEAYFGGSWVGEASTGLPNPARGDYFGRFVAETNDTTSERTLTVREASMGYYRDRQTR